MRVLREHGFDVADNLLAACAQCGYWLTPGTRILDLGCGEGALVYRLRDLGFDAYGFDIYDRVVYRESADRDFFAFLNDPDRQEMDRVVDPGAYLIPFDDCSFDVVVSTSVLEHVFDLDPLFSECARVLSRDGFAYHLFPNKWALVESHIYVPLAGGFHPWWWLYMWALVGARNARTPDLDARQMADWSVKYFASGLHYWTRGELFRTASCYFRAARFVDDAWYPEARRGVFWRNRMKALRTPGGLGAKMRALSGQRKLGSLLLARRLDQNQ